MQYILLITVEIEGQAWLYIVMTVIVGWTGHFFQIAVIGLHFLDGVMSKT
jgi:hypothetical protein